VVLGAVTGGLALGEKTTVAADCNAHEVCKSQAGVDAAQRGKALATASTVGWVVGLAGLGAGVGLLIASRPAAPVKAAVGLVALDGGGAIRVLGRF
jgi:hypothetical protein